MMEGVKSLRFRAAARCRLTVLPRKAGRRPWDYTELSKSSWADQSSGVGKRRRTCRDA